MNVGDIVAEAVTAAAACREFHTIAVDDGIAMGHDGMLYSAAVAARSSPTASNTWSTRIAQTPWCISNCDKITPGMLNGRAEAQHPDGVRLRRPDGGRHLGRRQRRRPPGRPDRRHHRVGR